MDGWKGGTLEGLFRGVHAPMSVGNLAGSQGRGCQGLSSISTHSRYRHLALAWAAAYRLEETSDPATSLNCARV